MAYTYKTKGVCARAIEFDLTEDKKVCNVNYIGGCDGNTTGIGKLVEGMDAAEVIKRLEGALFISKAKHSIS